MAYSANHLLFRAGGTFGAVSSEQLEIWSVGFRIFLGSSPLDESKKIAFLETVSGPVNLFHTDSSLKLHRSAYLKKLTAAYIGLDGKYVGGHDQPTTEYIYSSPSAGAGSLFYPFSNAMVFTLSSDIDRGPGSKGRVYWPTSEGLDATGRWSASAVNAYLTKFQTLINAINQAARSFWSPAAGVSVFSSVGSGAIGTVTSVGVGRAPDTQRRRDNRLAEEHVYLPVTSAAAAIEAVQNRVYAD